MYPENISYTDVIWKNVYLKSSANECEEKEDLPDVCKIALLKYYSDKEYSEEMAAVLHKVLREMCEKQLVFPYYLNYPEEWLREVQLYNKVMAAYRCKPGGKEGCTIR